MSHALNIHDASGIVCTDGAGKNLIGFGTSVPGAVAGWSKGAIFMHTDAATDITTIYVNVGTATSATFRPLYPFAQGAAITAADASSIDTTYGQQEADVLSNLRTRVGEIEARLEAAGIIAAN